MPPEKPINISDLGLILEVNKKVIQLETETANSYETIIEKLDEIKREKEGIFKSLTEKLDTINKKVDDKSEKVIKQNEDLSRELFTIKILFVGTILNLVVSVMQLFIKH